MKSKEIYILHERRFVNIPYSDRDWFRFDTLTIAYYGYKLGFNEAGSELHIQLKIELRRY